MIIEQNICYAPVILKSRMNSFLEEFKRLESSPESKLESIKLIESALYGVLQGIKLDDNLMLPHTFHVKARNNQKKRKKIYRDSNLAAGLAALQHMDEKSINVDSLGLEGIENPASRRE